jgi:hypothetical protein|tara:strand:+ start:553 stop:771 length:219 start_codon:yes stop_codon:yes gene_type:complete
MELETFIEKGRPIMDVTTTFDAIGALWPILVAFVGLVIVLSQTYYAVKTLEEKVRTLFDLFNKMNDELKKNK